MMYDGKNQPEQAAVPWDRWIDDRIDFGMDACSAFQDFLYFIWAWHQHQLLKTVVTGCCESFCGADSLLRFRLEDGWYVSYDVDTGKIRCVGDGTEWGSLDMPRGAREQLEEMLRQIRQENNA